MPLDDPAPSVTGNLGRLAQRLELEAVRQAVRPQAQLGIRAQTADLRKRLANAPAEVATMPAERLYADYVALTSMSAQQAEQYVLARPYLLGLICTCSMRKVGETPLQPGGRFDFCHLRPRRVTFKPGVTCHTTFAFKVRQRIQSNWVTVYDGVASHNWFAQGESADIRTWDWRALVCGSGPGDPPPSEGVPFAMVEYIGGPGSRHFNFLTQTGLSRTGVMGASFGTADVGEPPAAPQASNTLTIGQLLGAWPGFPTTHLRCTFSVYLHVRAKHFTGSARIESYDYHEQASFALEKTS